MCNERYSNNDGVVLIPEQEEIAGIKRYIEMMSGTVAIQNVPNVGTRLVIDIPVTMDIISGGNKSEESKSTHVARLDGERILLAENDELDAEIMSEFFKDAGADVVIASSGETAVDLYSQSDESYFDVILIDIMMPKMDGITASKQIRQLDRPDAAKVPIITMTSGSLNNYRQSAIDAGVSAYLTKPIDENALMSALKTVL
jgi:CheY-like chemotaxis protein